VALAKELGRDRKPQTVQNYLSHLSSVLRVARVAWGVDVDRDAARDALAACKHFGITAKSGKRDRRPTLEELNRLMEHFRGIEARRSSVPIRKVVAFAVFSARRQEEITRLRWADLEPGRILVRDMKHPGDKMGNDHWCLLVPEAEEIARSMPQLAPEIFPFSTDAISASFTRACKVLGIADLHFHDLRHEAASRLFEMGWTIPRVAEVTGHRTWQSLQRYSHLRQTGDKLAGWLETALAGR
jgi:integrase